MVKTRKTKPSVGKSTEDTGRAFSSVVRIDVILKVAAGRFKIPSSAMKDGVNMTERQNALRNETHIK